MIEEDDDPRNWTDVKSNDKRGLINIHSVDDQSGWQALAGFAGLEVKILSDDLDEAAKTGGRTRLVRFAAGGVTTHMLVHDYLEEVYMLSGDLRPASAADPPAAQFRYSCRPPGTPHGPFLSGTGCVLLEMQYYLR